MLLNRLFWSGLVLGLSYLFIDAFVANSDMILATRVLFVAVPLVVIVCWWPYIWDAVTSPIIRPGHISAAAVGLICGWMVVESAYLVIWRLAGQPKWFANSDLTAGILLYQVAAVSMLVMEPDTQTFRIPTRNRLASGVAVALAAVALLLLLGTRPDLAPLLEHVRPYITDWFDTGSLGIGAAHAG